MPQPTAAAPLVADVLQRLQERRRRIAVVGDIILDNVIEGEPGGFHSEFKIPLLRFATSHECIGGAANIALAVSRLGVDTVLFGLIGSDLTGRQLENLLDRHSFPSHLYTERGWPTPRKDWICTRNTGQVRLVQRIDYDRPSQPESREELVAEFRARRPDYLDVVILADHGVGSIGAESLELLDLARQAGAKIVAIPRSTLLRGQRCDAIILNASEMRQLAEGSSRDEVHDLAARYAQEHRQHVFLTLFEEGMRIFPADGRAPLAFPAFPQEHPDWMGVRDITAALVGLGLALDLELSALGQVAMVFRHLIAGQRGNGRLFWRDVAQFVELEESPLLAGV
ncbi:MAG TPA: PfkB family carbohydrate kinase [Gemmatales bacterium]|nr:PfkB family carbohydrate kinase [Gemmatales bacterium]HMP59354.1 PfkB family carbohydrate kinase [Gemmatales bacterium]